MGFALTLRFAVFFLGTCVFTQSASISKKTSQLLDGGDVHLVGDIMYTEQDYNRKFGRNDMRSSRAAIVDDSNRLWTNGTIHYDYAKDPGQDTKDRIEKAMREWERNTCIRFIRGKPADGYLLNIITDKGGCASFMGRRKKRQDLNLDSDSGCLSHDIILHKLGHAIGLIHEHCHPDRDKHLIIHWTYVMLGKEKNFYPSSKYGRVTNMKVPYDPYSIMHYSKNTFSINGEVVLETKDPALQDIIGNAKHLSTGDIKTVNLRYKCNDYVPICDALLSREGETSASKISRDVWDLRRDCLESLNNQIGVFLDLSGRAIVSSNFDDNIKAPACTPRYPQSPQKDLSEAACVRVAENAMSCFNKANLTDDAKKYLDFKAIVILTKRVCVSRLKIKICILLNKEMKDGKENCEANKVKNLNCLKAIPDRVHGYQIKGKRMVEETYKKCVKERGCSFKTCHNGGDLDLKNCQCKCTSSYVGHDCGCKVLRCQNWGTFKPSDCACHCLRNYHGNTCQHCDGTGLWGTTYCYG